MVLKARLWYLQRNVQIFSMLLPSFRQNNEEIILECFVMMLDDRDQLSLNGLHIFALCILVFAKGQEFPGHLQSVSKMSHL